MARLLPPERDIGVMGSPLQANRWLFAVFVVLLLGIALLDRLGADPDFAPLAIVGAALVLFILVALYSHSRRAVDFYVADRKAFGTLGGLAGASALAGILAVGVAGGAYQTRTSFLLSAMGLGSGYLLLALAIAPGLRAFGAYTAGDFIAARFGRILPRLAWAAITFAVSFFLSVATLKIASPLIGTLFGLAPDTALYITAGVMAMSALPGGMRSLSWMQAIQYMVIAVACLVPAGFFASGGPTAQSAIAAQFATLLADSLPAWGDAGAVGTALPVLLCVLGTASLPHLYARALSAPSGREAVMSMIWAVIYSVVLVLAGFVLFELLGEAAAAGIAADASGADRLAALIALLPPVLSGLVLAGMLAALLSLGEAALFAAATAISHDIWDEIIDRRGTEGRRILVARVIVAGVTFGAVTLISLWPVDAASLVSWALALAAAGCFAPLILGLWWPRCNEIGAIAGMVAGFGFTGLVFLLQQHVIPTAVVESEWSNVAAPTAAAAATLMSLIVTVGLSLVTPAPDKVAQALASGSEEQPGRMPVSERPA